MSSERAPEPNRAFSEGLSFELRQSMVEDFELEIDRRLLALEDWFLECEDHTEHIALKARAEQLFELRSPVMMMSKYELHGESLSLDDAAERAFMYNSVDWSTGEPVEQSTEDALKKGIMEGTNDLLEMLVPDHIKAAGFKEVYFLPWRFDFFYKKHQALPASDGTLSWNLPTKLPNIAINYHYTPDSNTPRRTIFYNGE